MAKKIKIKDTVHNFIEVEPVEAKVVNHDAFQRLRDITQLGLANYVYPTSTHTRFEHSIGVMHVTARMFDSLIENSVNNTLDLWKSKLAPLLDKKYSFNLSNLDRERFMDTIRRVMRLAALLHDVGHLPRSHSFEMGLKNIQSDLLPVRKEGDFDIFQGSAIHETIGHRIITNVLSEIINPYFASEGIVPDVAQFINDIFELPGTYLEDKDDSILGSLIAPLKAMVSGELDADRIDYVIRDSENTAARSGSFDLELLLRNLKLIHTNEKFYLVFNDKVVSTINSFFIFRYNLYVDVYHHAIISLYDAVFATLVEIYFFDLLSHDKTLMLKIYNRLVNGMLHAHNGKRGNDLHLISQPFIPIHDHAWELTIRQYIARQDGKWIKRMKTIAEFEGYITPTAYISKPDLLLKCLDNREYRPISLWKYYTEFKDIIIDPIIDLVVELDINGTLKKEISVKGKRDIVGKQVQGYFKNNDLRERIRRHIIENNILGRAFTFKEKPNQDNDSFHITEIVTCLQTYVQSKDYHIDNIFVSTKKLIEYKPVLIFHEKKKEVVQLKELSPFFDNIMDRSQDRPSFYLYLQTNFENATKIRKDLNQIREVVKNCITGWLRKEVNNMTMLEHLLSFEN